MVFVRNLFKVAAVLFQIVAIPIFAQSTYADIELELFIEQQNCSAVKTWTLLAQGAVWDKSLGYGLTSASYLIYPPSIVIEGNTNGSMDFGWTTTPSEHGELFGCTLYKVTVADDVENHIFIDYRDYNYWNITYPSQYTQDHLIVFDDDTKKFLWKSVNPDIGSLTQANNGDTLRIWLMKGITSEPITDQFQPTDPTNLSVTNSNGHPLLSWTASEPSSATYESYRSNSPTSGFQKQNVDPITGTSWSDLDVEVGGSTPRYYKVLAKSGDGTKSSVNYSNVVSINGAIVPQEDASVLGPVLSAPAAVALSAHPNPFNPSVALSFTLERDTEVDLRIVGLDGRVVEVLISGHRAPGRHACTWQGVDQASGVYVALLTVGPHTTAQKLVLLK